MNTISLLKSKNREGSKVFDVPRKKIAQKNFGHVGLTYFLALIEARPGTIEGLLGPKAFLKEM